jgi:hypothetical protein
MDMSGKPCGVLSYVDRPTANRLDTHDKIGVMVWYF